MTFDWNSIFQYLGGLGGFLLIVGAIAWLARELITHWMDRGVEAYKISWKATADAELERLKTTLQMGALEHQVRFSKLHEERAKVIAELYTQAFEFERAAQAYAITHPRPGMSPGEEEDFDQLSKLGFDFQRFFEVKRIYLSEDVDQMVGQFLMEVREAAIAIHVSGGHGQLPLVEYQKYRDTILKAMMQLRESVPVMRLQLMKEFRKILDGR